MMARSWVEVMDPRERFFEGSAAFVFSFKSLFGVVFCLFRLVLGLDEAGIASWARVGPEKITQ